MSLLTHVNIYTISLSAHVFLNKINLHMLTQFVYTCNINSKYVFKLTPVGINSKNEDFII